MALAVSSTGVGVAPRQQLRYRYRSLTKHASRYRMRGIGARDSPTASVDESVDWTGRVHINYRGQQLKLYSLHQHRPARD